MHEIVFSTCLCVLYAFHFQYSSFNFPFPYSDDYCFSYVCCCYFFWLSWTFYFNYLLRTTTVMAFIVTVTEQYFSSCYLLNVWMLHVARIVSVLYAVQSTGFANAEQRDWMRKELFCGGICKGKTELFYYHKLKPNNEPPQKRVHIWHTNEKLKMSTVYSFFVSIFLEIFYTLILELPFKYIWRSI